MLHPPVPVCVCVCVVLLKVYNALRRLEWQTNREVDKAVTNLMASSNKVRVRFVSIRWLIHPFWFDPERLGLFNDQ